VSENGILVFVSNVGEIHARISQRDGRQRDPFTVVIVVITIMVIIVSLQTLAGYSSSLRTQATCKLTSLPAVQFVQGYHLEYARPLIGALWFCAGTGVAVISSATGPTEYLKYTY
jgi:hypothetical protein